MKRDYELTMIESYFEFSYPFIHKTYNFPYNWLVVLGQFYLQEYCDG